MNRILVNPRRGKGTIQPNLYGHFAEHLGRCIYDGVYVGPESPIPNLHGMRTDVVEALRGLNLPVLRWPGGCFADEYHWRDGIGAPGSRKRMVNTHWGYVVEDNAFGTHEFMELCRQIGCEPYVNANVGSGTVREMSEWVEYVNSDSDSTVANERRMNGRQEPFGVKYWGVGNESWGCGGNMRPEYYADLYRQYQTYCRRYGENALYKIACGANTDDYAWTETLMKNAGRYMDAISLHYYTVPKTWEDKGSATAFDPALYYETLQKAAFMEALITNHLAIMDRYDPQRRVGLVVDEWGCWHNVEPGTNSGFLYQQNTMRDAMVAALTLNIFNRHCDRVVMANLAQMVNVLQAVILTQGAEMVLTPTYHVFDLYRPHMGAQEADCKVQCGCLANGMEQLSASASVRDGRLTVTLANLSAKEATTVCLQADGYDGMPVTGRMLSGEIDACNTFAAKDTLAPRPFDGFVWTEQGLRLTVPRCSVLSVTLDV